MNMTAAEYRNYQKQVQNAKRALCGERSYF